MDKLEILEQEKNALMTNAIIRLTRSEEELFDKLAVLEKENIFLLDRLKIFEQAKEALNSKTLDLSGIVEALSNKVSIFEKERILMAEGLETLRQENTSLAKKVIDLSRTVEALSDEVSIFQKYNDNLRNAFRCQRA